MVDGVGPVRGFVHVILPVCKPILGAAALSFADCWNMVEQPLIYLANHTNLQPLSVMFNQISTDRRMSPLRAQRAVHPADAADLSVFPRGHRRGHSA